MTKAEPRRPPRRRRADDRIDWPSALAEHDRWLRTVVYSRLGEPQAVDEPPPQMAADADSISVPVGRVDNLDEWLEGLPAALPEDAQRALERSGYRVYQTRELVPMGVEDGRRLVVPVDRVNIRYVGNPPL